MTKPSVLFIVLSALVAPVIAAPFQAMTEETASQGNDSNVSIKTKTRTRGHRPTPTQGHAQDTAAPTSVPAPSDTPVETTATDAAPVEATATGVAPAVPSPSADESQPESAAPSSAPPSGPTYLEAPDGLKITQNPTPEDLAGTSELAKTMVNAYNDFRGQVGAKLVEWDTALAAKAYNQTTLCYEKHENDENIMWDYGETFNPVAMVKSWGSEWSDWDYTRTSDFPASHFTEMVWKATTKIACSWSLDCETGPDLFLTCKHGPAGNNGAYVENVGRLGDKA